MYSECSFGIIRVGGKTLNQLATENVSGS